MEEARQKADLLLKEAVEEARQKVEAEAKHNSEEEARQKAEAEEAKRTAKAAERERDCIRVQSTKASQLVLPDPNELCLLGRRMGDALACG